MIASYNMEMIQPHIIDLPKICDPRGNLTFVEEGRHVPFGIARAFWIYDVPAGEERGGHSHYKLYQLLVSVAGSFDVNVTDGFAKRTFTLNRPFKGLVVPPGIWSDITNFSSGGVCLSLVDDYFSEEDYVRDFNDYLAIARERGPIMK